MAVHDRTRLIGRLRIGKFLDASAPLRLTAARALGRYCPLMRLAALLVVRAAAFEHSPLVIAPVLCVCIGFFVAQAPRLQPKRAKRCRRGRLRYKGEFGEPHGLFVAQAPRLQPRELKRARDFSHFSCT
jgi:hypothetical protein